MVVCEELNIGELSVLSFGLLVLIVGDIKVRFFLVVRSLDL